MADISNVNLHEIKDLYENLEGLSCESGPAIMRQYQSSELTLHSSDHDQGPVLGQRPGSRSFFDLCPFERVDEAVLYDYLREVY